MPTHLSHSPLLRRGRLLWLVLVLAAAPAAATPSLNVELYGTDLFANAPFESDVTQSGGVLHLMRALDTPTLPPADGIDGPAFVEGYADESGTFWAAATTGLVPYVAHSDVWWRARFVKNSASDTVDADVTGAFVRLMYFGGFDGLRLSGRVEFFVWVGADRQVTHTVEISKEAGVGTDFVKSELGDLESHTSYVFDANHATWILDPITLSLDLGAIPVGGEFDVDYFAFVTVEGAGGETSASAYFRDPISQTGGITLTPRGPTPVDVPEPAAALQGAVGVALLAAAARRRRRRLPG